jgi:hypothetical protein
MRRFVLLLLVVALLFGAPHAAGILNRVMGPWSVDAVQVDGSVTHMEFGAHLPRPDWLPVPRDATIVQASRSTSPAIPGGFHILEVTTREPLDNIKKLYLTGLQAAGFMVSDTGTVPLDTTTARVLGLDGTIEGERPVSGETVTIQIRSLEGILLPSRLLQIYWRNAAGGLG